MKNSSRRYAIISGISLIIMALAAGYSYGYVFTSLIIPSDPQATLLNLQNQQALFGSGIVGWLIILITDLLVAWGLYKFFETVNQKISLITGLLRGAYSAVLAFAILHLFYAWNIMRQANADALELLDQLEGFESIWSLGLIVFGIHLIGIGYLSIKSASVPKWLGILLCIAGAFYSIINGAKALYPEAADTILIIEMSMSAPMAIAEIGLAVWLIWKGGKNSTNLAKS